MIKSGFWFVLSALVILSAFLFMLQPGRADTLFWLLVIGSLGVGLLARFRAVALPRRAGQGLRLAPLAQVGALLSVVIVMFICQYILYPDPRIGPVDALFWLMAVAALAVGIFCTVRGSALIQADDPFTAPAQLPRVRVRLRWLLLSLALTVYMTWRTAHSPQGAYAGEYLACWALALFAFVRAVAAPAVPDTQALRRQEIGLLAVLFVAALLVRGVAIDSVPYLLDQDEARFALNGVGVRLNHFEVSPFKPGDHTHPYLNYILTGFTTGLFGETLTGTRLPSVIMGALSIPVIYLIGRELIGWGGGLAAALFALTWPFQVHFSRLALNQAGDALFAMLPFYFLLRGLRRGAPVDYALSGITLAAAQLFYAGGRITPLIMLAFLAYLLLRRWRFIRGQWRQLALLGLALLVFGLPQHYYLIYYQKPLTDRHAPNIFLSGHFQHSVEAGIDPFFYLSSSVRRSFMALFSVRDSGGWYGPGSNLMGPFGGPPLLIGGVVSLILLWRRPRWSLPLGWAFSVILLLSVFSTYPPQYQRFFPASAALALLVGLGTSAVASTIAALLGQPTWRHRLALGAGVLLAAANLAFYVDVYVPARHYIANRPNWATNRAAQEMVAAHDAGRQVIVVAAFRTGVEHSGVIKYFMTGRKYLIIEDEAPLAEQPDAVSAVDITRPFTFIIAPTRPNDVRTLMERFPGGERRDVILEEDSSIAFYVYESASGLPPPPPQTIS